MPTVKEKFQELFSRKKNWCSTAEGLLKDNSADMYNSSRRPDIWLQGCAYMNLSKAKDAVAAIVQQVASELDAGDLKTNMLTVTASMTDQECLDLEAWAEPRRNGGSLLNPQGVYVEETRLLFTAAKFLRTEAKDYAGGAARHFLQREIDKGQTVQEAALVVANFLRSQVTLVEWRGSYT